MLGAILSLPDPPLGSAQGARRGIRVLPFAVLMGASLVTYMVANQSALSATETTVLIALATGLMAAWALAPWDSLPRLAQAALPVGVIALIVLMQAFVLPGDRDLAALMILPVLWSAAFGTGCEALGTSALAAGSILALHIIGVATGSAVGMTGWTEVVAICGGLVLLGGFTVTARAHARTDALTGAANRRAWDETLPQELERARRHRLPVAVAIIDLDEFKRFNDTHGHAAGDRHLAACVSAWRRCLRPYDLLARLGGEEFAVLLTGPDGRISERASRLIDVVPGDASCSIGIARWNGTESPSQLMARADDALYEAKGAGRGRSVTARAALVPTAA